MEQTRTTLDNSELHHYLSLGQFMNVEVLNTHHDRFNSTLIGLKPRKFLLLELPNIVKRGELLDRMIMNNKLVVRIICEFTTGDCLAFETTVDSIVKIPHPMVYLDYPVKLVFHQLRKENRKQLFIPAILKISSTEEDAEETQGTIVDISAGGCRLELEDEQLFEKLDDRQLEVSYLDPETGQQATRPVRLCSTRKKGSKEFYIGLAFSD